MLWSFYSVFNSFDISVVRKSSFSSVQLLGFSSPELFGIKPRTRRMMLSQLIVERGSVGSPLVPM